MARNRAGIEYYFLFLHRLKRVAIIGAGAAGSFCAVQLRKAAPELPVTVFEAAPRPMAKLAVTGGGRCNLTNSFEGISSLSEAYPRGERLMKRALKVFSQEDTVKWFEQEGIPLVLQSDHCWFPRSQNAMDIVRCLERGMKGADLRLRTPVQEVVPEQGSYLVNAESFDYVVVTTGGATRGLSFLNALELETIPPVPSLFTFTVPDAGLRSLMGLVADASVSLPGTKFTANGPLLITDWGLSGPATLKLSAYAARYLAERQYKGSVLVNWLNAGEIEVRERLRETASAHPQKQVSTVHPLQQRLWEHLLERAGVRKDLRWAELGSKGLNRLTAVLTTDTYPLSGKSKFRDEFVTAGGVSLGNIDLSTLECKRHKGIFFAGEVLDIDAITGGFNLQAAWSTGFICARGILKTIQAG